MTTINVAIAANADDGNTFDNTNFDASAVRVIAGQVASRIYDTWLRFAVSNLSGATINNGTNLKFFGNGPGGTGLTTIGVALGADAPAAPTSAAEHVTLQGNVSTEITYDFAMINNVSATSPELKAAVQALADAQNPSIIIFLHDDDGSADGVVHRYDALEDGTGNEVVLNIEYTPAAGGLSIPVAMHHYKQMMGVN